ncbi:unnamed protein product [Clavelina lepadiformis]|uniref:Transmembrane and coiled-coil domains protein 1 n=1 Tax=Clavelina lepadiformis TaxID=159417 RepID=A0ABP0GJW2_CLALP
MPCLHGLCKGENTMFCEDNADSTVAPVSTCTSYVSDGAWSDVTSDDNDDETAVNEASFLDFAEKHSSHSCFQQRNRVRSNLSLAISKNVKRTDSSGAKETSPNSRSVSAPHTPSGSPTDEVIGLQSTGSTGNIPEITKTTASFKEAVMRSRSLEPNARHRKFDEEFLEVHQEERKWFKKRIFGSSSSINKPSFYRPSRCRDAVGEMNIKGKEPQITTSDSSTNLKLWFLKHNHLAQVKFNHGKGHKNAIDEFKWKARANERNSLENTARISSAGSSSGQLPAGQVLEQMILPVMSSQLSTAYSQDSSSLTSYDSVDGSPANEERSKQLTEHYKQKIIKTSEQIKTEQSTRDDNVAEYLKLATNADKQQAARIKNVFEKKNQKSSYNIAQLQKKLDGYHRRLKELENNGGGRSGRLRDVGANLKEISGGVVDSVKGSLSGLQQATGAIVSKPKDLASKLKNRFGSNDNINNIKDDDYEENQLHAKFGSTDDVSSTSSIDYPSVPDDPNQLGRLSFPSGSDSPPCSQVSRRFDSQQIQAVANQLVTLKTDIQELRQSQTQMESEWQEWKAQMHKEHDILTNTLNVEMSRYARLENQLNDVTELHQREVTILKQELTSMEEKLEYHANERARDMQEAIENCQTRVAKMELQHQQRVSVEGLENASARALITKLINLLLSVMAVILVLVSTVSGLLMPFMRSQGRMLTTLIVVIAMIIAYKNWNLISVWLGSLRR